MMPFELPGCSVCSSMRYPASDEASRREFPLLRLACHTSPDPQNPITQSPSTLALLPHTQRSTKDASAEKNFFSRLTPKLGAKNHDFH